MDKPISYFGTDGIRGVVGESPIQADFILKLGWAIGQVLAHHFPNPKVYIGKDTRISGYMIESALQAGLSAAGTHVYLLGPMPTPAIAYLTRTFRGDMGIVISASHNPYDHNGIKFFSADGFKISKEIEHEINAKLAVSVTTKESKLLGRAWRVDDAAGRYIEYTKSTVPHRIRLDNLKIVVDCANGATYHIAPHVFSELGADIIRMNTNPDGFNINTHCGSTYPSLLQQKVIETHADLGIAFDGDGDRVIMVDKKGEILEGDEILYIITKELIKTEHFFGGVVGTQLSNMGLEVGLKKLGVEFVRAAVGDQYVLRELLKRNWILGGEPSGHILYLPGNTTADGIVAALQVLHAMYSCSEALHDLKKGMHKYPQQCHNIPHKGQRIDLENQQLAQFIAHSKKNLGENGRILLRYSGTEPLIRLMVEGSDLHCVEKETQNISNLITDLVNKTNA